MRMTGLANVIAATCRLDCPQQNNYTCDCAEGFLTDQGLQVQFIVEMVRGSGIFRKVKSVLSMSAVNASDDVWFIRITSPSANDKSISSCVFHMLPIVSQTLRSWPVVDIALSIPAENSISSYTAPAV